MIKAYAARVVNVVDGDTVDVVVFDEQDFLGFKTKTEKAIRVRLLGIDVPERYTPGGRAATAALSGLLWDATFGVYKTVSLWTQDDRVDSFGRLLGTLFIDNGGQLNVNQWMLDNGYARVYGTKEPLIRRVFGVMRWGRFKAA